MMFNVEIYISLKKTVADPQGATIKHALESLGHKNLLDVRMGKFIKIKINSNDKSQAEKQAVDFCQKLLANPVIEDYSIKIEEVK
ncbi:MAG: phosphoribosylformylglycinamidine synthase [Candidatus Saganbacteria bacterium]|uniref:Phosphoribosylformylglycinamidine synthase subunit PurS n=1 Tax=Candidatus Saganbacteria bacterium TaxID=2575572 RepID=A0A833L1E8_UNCSA|nr:MAG: phosphoribosylformylglycinamidine synthase [Candidatus Saganbacteria bacterium]